MCNHKNMPSVYVQTESSVWAPAQSWQSNMVQANNIINFARNKSNSYVSVSAQNQGLLDSDMFSLSTQSSAATPPDQVSLLVNISTNLSRLLELLSRKPVVSQDATPPPDVTPQDSPPSDVPSQDAQPSQDVPSQDAQPSQDVPSQDAQPSQDAPSQDAQPSQDVTPQDTPPSDVPSQDAQPSPDVTPQDAPPSDVLSQDATPSLVTTTSDDVEISGLVSELKSQMSNLQAGSSSTERQAVGDSLQVLSGLALNAQVPPDLKRNILQLHNGFFKKTVTASNDVIDSGVICNVKTGTVRTYVLTNLSQGEMVARFRAEPPRKLTDQRKASLASLI